MTWTWTWPAGPPTPDSRIFVDANDNVVTKLSFLEWQPEAAAGGVPRMSLTRHEAVRREKGNIVSERLRYARCGIFLLENSYVGSGGALFIYYHAKYLSQPIDSPLSARQAARSARDASSRIWLAPSRYPMQHRYRPTPARRGLALGARFDPG